MIGCAAKTIGCTVIDLLTSDHLLAEAKHEFDQRTGGGVQGNNWQAPLCDYEPPLNFRWPEYITTERGHEWWIPG
jgi:aminobenzoyl-glutamate utilization protein B